MEDGTISNNAEHINLSLSVMRSKHDVTNAVATLQDIKNQSRRNPNIMNSFRVLWSNVPHRIANRTEKSYVEQFNAASDVPCFNTQMKNRPIIKYSLITISTHMSS